MKSKLNRIWGPFIVLIAVIGCSSRIPTTTPAASPIGTPHATATMVVQELVQETATLNTKPLATPLKTATITPQKDEPGFGVEISRLDVDFSKIRALGAMWVRYNGVLWSDVEPQEGVYHWEKLANLEEALRQANAAGLNVVLIVRSTPTWAQKVPGSFCGPILTDKLQAFANFMSSLAMRYNTALIRVKYWELWNEPDVDPTLVPGTSVFGCWGDNSDEFYGGGYYAEMLKVATPSIHAANPEAKVFLGGLLLDCDPTDVGTAGRCTAGYDLPPKFFEGILKAGGAGYIDFVSYHGYPMFDPKESNPILSELNMPSWQARGGSVMGKANFLREMMAKYNVNIPLFLTETSLLCPEKTPGCNPPGAEFLQEQAEYGAWLLVRNYAEGIGTIWFTFDGPGWRSSGVLDDQQKPKPVYYSLQYLGKLLTGSLVLGKIENADGVTYKFSNPNRNFSFIYPFNGHPKIILDQDNNIQTLDIFGKQIPNN